MAVARIAPALMADAWSFGQDWAEFLDHAHGEAPDHPDDRIIVRGGEDDDTRRPTEDCLQQIHMGWPNLADWGKA